MYLHMYYAVNVAVVIYFGLLIPDGPMKIELGSESADLHGKDLSES